MRTKGLSRKVLADLFTSVAAFAVAFYGVDLDATESAVLAKALGFLAGYLAPPNEVTPS